MEFKIIINKWANFYFFISNLSEWHFSCRKDYNILWQKELETFTPEEESSLKKFKEIRSKYKSSRTHFEEAFFTLEEPLKHLKNHLSQEEYKMIEEIFSLLEKKFNFLYEKEIPSLEQWQKNLDEKINDPALLQSIINVLSILFNASVPETEIKIYLLFSNVDHTGGGANIDAQSISLEISRYPLENIGQALGIIWHEVTHLLFQNQYFYSLVLQYCHGDQKTANSLNEITINSLLPRGILGIRLFKNKPPHVLFPQINPQQTIDILNLTKSYIGQNKAFDENYIVQLHSIIKRGPDSVTEPSP